MRRRLADIIAVLCLVLFVLFAFMWVRSYAVADQLRHHHDKGFKGVLSSRGSIAIFTYDTSRFITKTDPGWSFQSGGTIDIAAEELTRAARHHSFLGFWLFHDSKLPQFPNQILPGRCLVVPYWFFTLLYSLIPLGRLLRMNEKRAKKKA